MANIGLLKIGMTVATGGLKSGLASASQSITGFKSGVQSAVGSSIAAFGQLGLAIQGVKAVLGGIASVVSAPLKLAADAESTSIAFEVLIGDAEQAQKTLKSLTDFANNTPFDLVEVKQAARSLISAGVSTDQLENKLTALGNVASAVQMPLKDIASIMAKNKQGGMIQGEDLNQLADRGLPVFRILAKEMGVGQDEIRKLGSQGKISFDILDRAMTKLGNVELAGLMDRQSRSLGGLWSAMAGGIDTALTEIGFAISDTFNLKGAMTKISAFISGSMPMIKSFMEQFKAAVNAVTPIIQAWWNATSAQFKAIGEIAHAVFGGVGNSILSILPSFKQVQSFLINFYLTGEWVFTNWRSLVDMAVTTTAYSLVKFGGQVQHVFGTVIPTVLVWLGNNWKEILHDIAVATASAFTNITSNIANVFMNLPGLISGKVKFDDIWKPLLSGAKFALKELPNIPERQISALESNLQRQVQDTAASLVEDFQVFKADRMDKLFPPEMKQQMEEMKTKAKEVETAVKNMIPAEMKEKAKKVFEDTRTDVEKFKTELDSLKEMMSKGAIDGDTFNRAVTNALPDKVKGIIDKTKTPLQKFQEELQQLETFKTEGFLNTDQFNMAVGNLQKEVFGKTDKMAITASAELGSKEASNAIVKHSIGYDNDPMKNLDKTAKQQLMATQQTIPLLQQIARQSPVLANILP